MNITQKLVPNQTVTIRSTDLLHAKIYPSNALTPMRSRGTIPRSQKHPRNPARASSVRTSIPVRSIQTVSRICSYKFYTASYFKIWGPTNLTLPCFVAIPMLDKKYTAINSSHCSGASPLESTSFSAFFSTLYAVPSTTKTEYDTRTKPRDTAEF